MPDITRHKYVNGKLCCWNTEIKQFVEVRKHPIEDFDFYKEVVASFMGDPIEKDTTKYLSKEEIDALLTVLDAKEYKE